MGEGGRDRQTHPGCAIPDALNAVPSPEARIASYPDR